MGTKYTSRFPEIIAELPLRLDHVAEAGAHLIEETAKQRVPVATGKLRDSIHVEHDRRGEYTVVAGDNEAWYGMLVEHGTRYNPPHPFLVPSLEAERDAVLALAMRELRGL